MDIHIPILDAALPHLIHIGLRRLSHGSLSQENPCKRQTRWAVIRSLTSCLIFSDSLYVNPLPLLTLTGDSASLLAMQLVLPPPPTHFLSPWLRGIAHI
jgi:hypothetical protein